ncbi:MAG: metallophosphoesterase [Promethearchaeota archaeon]
MWAVLSDSHDNLDAIKLALDTLSSYSIELFFHCGDVISPFTVPKLDMGVPVKAVRGNNDGEFLGLYKMFQQFPEWEFTQGVLTVETDYGKVAVTHGHIPGVLPALLSGSEFKFIFSGHDHNAQVKKVNGILWANSGECGGWLRGRKTIAVVDPQKSRAEIIEIK